MKVFQKVATVDLNVIFQNNPKSCQFWSTFESNFVAQTFQKQTNLVTLDLGMNETSPFE